MDRANLSELLDGHRQAEEEAKEEAEAERHRNERNKRFVLDDADDSTADYYTTDNVVLSYVKTVGKVEDEKDNKPEMNWKG